MSSRRTGSSISRSKKGNEMKKSILFLVCIMTFAQAIIAQKGNVELAEVYSDMGEYSDAIAVYQASYEMLDEFQLYKLARLYTTTAQDGKAIKVYKDIVKNYPDFQKAYLPLAEALRKQGEYAEAMKYYEVYGNFDPYVSQHFVEAMRWAENTAKTQKVAVVRKEMSWNTTAFDGFPAAYEENIVYASDRRDMVRPSFNSAAETTQLFSTHRTEGGSFSQPTFLLKDLQAWKAMPLIAMNPTSNEVIFTRITQAGFLTELRSEVNGMSLYTAQLIDGELIDIKAMPFNGVDYNTAAACYTADGNTIYFMSNKKGGYGGYDIYRSTRTLNGKWTKAENLGSTINTAGDETFPQSIKEKLVYASNWMKGFGGYDLFQTQFNAETAEWTKPMNLGYGVNTQRDEYALTHIGNQYYLTAMNEEGNVDVYSFNSLPTMDKAAEIVNTSYTEKHIDMSNEFQSAFANVSQGKTHTSGEADARRASVPVMVQLTDRLEKGELAAIKQNPAGDIETIYTVQVAIVGLNNTEQLQYYGEQLSDVDAVYKVYFPEVIKIRVGSYDSYERAKKTLNVIRSRGYGDAFIVEEQVIYSSSSADLRPTVAEQAAETQQSASTERQDDDFAAESTPVGKYKVRIATYSQPKWFSPEKVDELGNIQRMKHGNFTIFLLGDYSDVDTARAIQQKVISRGYKGAQVVTITDGEIHRID